MERHIFFAPTICFFSILVIFLISAHIEALPAADINSSTVKNDVKVESTEDGDFPSLREEFLSTEPPKVSAEEALTSSEIVSSTQISSTGMATKNESQSTTTKITVEPSTNTTYAVQSVGSSQNASDVHHSSNDLYDTKGTDTGNTSIDIFLKEDNATPDLSLIEETATSTDPTDVTQTDEENTIETTSQSSKDDMDLNNENPTPILGDSTSQTSEESNEGQGLDSSNTGVTTRKKGHNFMVVWLCAIFLVLRPTLA